MEQLGIKLATISPLVLCHTYCTTMPHTKWSSAQTLVKFIILLTDTQANRQTQTQPS